MTNAGVFAKPSLYSAQTDPGRKRPNNEDYLAVFEADATESGAPRLQVAVVADGVGGHQAGERASKMAAMMVRMVMTRDTHLPPSERIARAFRAANDEVYGASLDRPDQEGMSTTLVMAVIAGDTLFGAHAGDSRAYLFRTGVLERLTADHTWAQEAIESGYLTPERALNHPNRNVIQRFIGTKDALDVDPRLTDVAIPANSDNPYAPRPTVESLPVEPGDIVLLCSDGLTDELRDEDIAAILGKTPFERAADRLVKEANQRGGRDNITVVLLQVGSGGGLVTADHGRAAPGPTRAADRSEAQVARPRFPIWLPLAVLVVLALLGVGVWAARRDTKTPTVAILPTPSATSALVAVAPEASPTPPAAARPLPTASPLTSPSATPALLGATSTPFPVASLGETPIVVAATSSLPRSPMTPIANTRSPAASPPADVARVTLLAPAEGEKLSGMAIFSFTADRDPASGHAYDVAFWRRDQDPLVDGLSPGLYIETGSGVLRINLDELDKQESKFEPGDYLWGVRLIEVKSLRPVGLLGEPRRFHFERSGQEQGNGDKPTAVPPTAEPPVPPPPGK